MPLILKLLHGKEGQCAYLLLTAVFPVIIFFSITLHDFKFILKQNNGRCATGFFSCIENPNVCIRQDQWCNNVKDCPDNKDEDFIICSPEKNVATVYSSSIFTFKTLPTFEKKENKKLSHENLLIENNLDLKNYTRNLDIEKCASSKCVCKRASFICNNLPITEVPADIPKKEFIHIKNTKVSVLKKNDFYYLPNLKLLSLKHNLIYLIENGTFRYLKKLIRLYITGNNLEVIHSKTFEGLDNLILLDLTHNKIKRVTRNSFYGLPRLNTLVLEHNELGLEAIEYVSFPPNSNFINLAHNKLRKVLKNMFTNCGNVRIFLLSHNQINYIEDNAFERFHSLKDLYLDNNCLKMLPRGFQKIYENNSLHFLDLGYNPLKEIEEGTLINLDNLLTLNLTAIELKNLKTSIFLDLISLKSIEFSTFEMCRYVPSVMVCKPNTDGISSITNLLHIRLLGICIWLVATVTCIGNALVMICRIIFREEKNVHSLFIKNLAAADFMFGIYLFVIASHDVMFRDQYNIYANIWMEGWTCQITGFIGIMAFEVSVFILTCMSLECCLTVSHPLKPRMMSVQRASLVLVSIWICGGIIAGIPIMFSTSFGQFYGGNGVCLPLHIHDPFVNGWQYSTFIFIFVNLVAMFLIIISYAVILFSFKKTRSMVPFMGIQRDFKLTPKFKNINRKIHSMDKRLFVIVLTNVLCWIPIIIIKILALNSIKISDIFYAWLTIFVVPINSALNPIIYSITTSTFRQKFNKKYNLKKIKTNVKDFAVGFEQKMKDRQQPRQRMSGSTAASLLGLPDIMLLHHRIKNSNTINQDNIFQESSNFLDDSFILSFGCSSVKNNENVLFNRAQLSSIDAYQSSTNFEKEETYYHNTKKQNDNRNRAFTISCDFVQPLGEYDTVKIQRSHSIETNKFIE